MTRVFQRAASYGVTVSVSFTDKASAERFARAVDRLKAQAAREGRTLSRRLLELLERAK